MQRGPVGEPIFLPTNRDEMAKRGWAELDILMVSGDAHVDHPAFGASLIARFLEGRGFRVGVVAQPRWDSIDDLTVMGRPRLFVGVTAGNLDSMLNKLTAQKKVRSEDPYSPGGIPGLRPNRATVVYSNLCRQAFPGLPIVLGGIEASLRRIAHYDYWSDSVRRSVLLDAKADLLVFGMGERAVEEIACRLDRGEPVEALREIRGTAWVANRGQWESAGACPSTSPSDGRVVVLPSFEAVESSKSEFAEMTRLAQLESNARNARPLIQPHGTQAVWLNPPGLPLTEVEMDALYHLPFTRRPHPRYGAQRIPAYDTVKHSLVTLRGCFGGCSFCSITAHEGRAIQNRSADSVIRELRELSRLEGFSGTVTDLGGPTANMYRMHCREPRLEAVCRKLSCLHPKICRNLVTDHRPLLSLLERVRREPAVRRVHLASGIRYDLALESPEFIRTLAQHHTGGQLSVAPEHTDPRVLDLMKKPPIAAYERFAQQFQCASQTARKEQYIIPYFIVGHPGSTLQDTVELALWVKRCGLRPRQVQEFIPTPMSVATCMYYTGMDPFSGSPLPVVRELREKRLMKALLLWWDEAQEPLAREALARVGRLDLVGRGPGCLVPHARDAGRPRCPVPAKRGRSQ